MKNYLAFISGFLSFAGFIIYKDRKDFNRLTKEIDETNKKIKDEQDSHFAKFTKTK
jgi:cell division protein FtsL